MIRIGHDLADHDRFGICLVKIPPLHQSDIHVGVRLRLWDETGEKVGVVLELSRNSWIARVRLEDPP